MNNMEKERERKKRSSVNITQYEKEKKLYFEEIPTSELKKKLLQNTTKRPLVSTIATYSSILFFIYSMIHIYSFQTNPYKLNHGNINTVAYNENSLNQQNEFK